MSGAVVAPPSTSTAAGAPPIALVAPPITSDAVVVDKTLVQGRKLPSILPEIDCVDLVRDVVIKKDDEGTSYIKTILGRNPLKRTGGNGLPLDYLRKLLTKKFPGSVSKGATKQVCLKILLLKMLQPGEISKILFIDEGDGGGDVNEEGGGGVVVQNCTMTGGNCRLRVLNVIFADKNYQYFLDTGKAASKDSLTSGMAGYSQHFWADAQNEYMVEMCAEYDDLQFNHIAFNGMNPGENVRAHPWKKLQTIFKEARTRYNNVMRNFTQSGTHDSDFWAFCHGQSDAMYLRCWLERRPEGQGLCIE